MLSVEGVQNAISRLVVGFVVVLAVWSLSCVISLLEEDTTMGGDPKSFENSTGGANDPADEPDKDSTAPVEWGADDPFKVLGLSGGIEDNTIEDVTKVKRKLALKFHPDRNIENQEWATRKMQEINDAFARIKNMYEGHDDEDGGPHDEFNTGDSGTDSGSEAETEHERRRREKFERKKRKKDLDDELKKFKRAQKAAEHERWSKDEFEFKPPPQAAPPSAKRGKPKSKKAKKKEAQKRRKQANQKQKKGQEESGPMDTEERPAEENETPFHRLVVEERVARRFSPNLVKNPVFTAIRTHSWTVFQSYYLYSCDSQDEFERGIAGRIELLYIKTGYRESVTPLQIACYLGDYEAGTTILSLVGERWKQAVGARSSDGSSCHDLAEEALEIAKALVEDAKEKLAEAEAGGEAKKIEWATSLCSKCTREMESAERTVEWIGSLASHRKKRRKRSQRTRQPNNRQAGSRESGLWQKIVADYLQFILPNWRF